MNTDYIRGSAYQADSQRPGGGEGFDASKETGLQAVTRTLEGAGRPLADQYQAQELDMLYTHAQFEDGSVSVEAGIQDMLIRMESGRFKVFKHLIDWFDEYRLYHRKDGRVHKEGDDLMSATRYAIIMRAGLGNLHRTISGISA